MSPSCMFPLNGKKKKIPGVGSFYYKDKAELFLPMHDKHICLTELCPCILKSISIFI